MARMAERAHSGPRGSAKRRARLSSDYRRQRVCERDRRADGDRDAEGIVGGTGSLARPVGRGSRAQARVLTQPFTAATPEIAEKKTPRISVLCVLCGKNGAFFPTSRTRAEEKR